MLKTGMPLLPPSPALNLAHVAAASMSPHFSGAVASESWASLVVEDDDSDKEELAPMTPSSSLASDPAVLVEGLGSLSMSPVASGGPAEVPCADEALKAPSLLWVASLDSDEDDDDEELVPQSPLAGSVHVEEVVADPCGGLSASTDALGNDDDWVLVGRGGRPSREPSSLL
jgi:hypothetical protein